MPWIRAIDRLPNYFSDVRVRFEDGQTEWMCDIKKLINELENLTYEGAKKLLWLDDAPNPLLEEIKQLRSFFRKRSPLTEMMDKIIKKYEGVGDN